MQPQGPAHPVAPRAPRLTRRAFGACLAAPLAAALLPRRAAAALPRGPLPEMKALYYRFANSPFPYNGPRPDDGKPFLDVQTRDGRLGHTSPRGGVYYLDPTYSDQRVLAALPSGFDLQRKGCIVVFFHGNQTILERDVVERQKVLDQLEDSGLNAAFLAPQFAVDALDSSAGRFWEPGFFSRFLAEGALALAELWGNPVAKMAFAAMPVILVAYSGGYNPLAYAISVGGAGRRVAGVVLLDALFGEEDRFTDWVRDNRRHAFFLSTFTESSEPENAAVRDRLKTEGVGALSGPPRVLAPGTVDFFPTLGHDHATYMTDAWVDTPLAWVLDRVRGYPRG